MALKERVNCKVRIWCVGNLEVGDFELRRTELLRRIRWFCKGDNQLVRRCVGGNCASDILLLAQVI